METFYGFLDQQISDVKFRLQSTEFDFRFHEAYPYMAVIPYAYKPLQILIEIFFSKGQIEVNLPL